MGSSRHIRALWNRSDRFERELASLARRSPALCSCQRPPTTRSASSRNSPVDVIVDVTGVFDTSPTSQLRFTPVYTDTDGGHRESAPAEAKVTQGVGQTIEIGAAPDSAVAVTGTITMADPGVGGLPDRHDRAASRPACRRSSGQRGRGARRWPTR